MAAIAGIPELQLHNRWIARFWYGMLMEQITHNREKGISLFEKSETWCNMFERNSYQRDWHGIKSIMVELYTLYQEKAKTFKHLSERLLSYSFQNWCVIGDYNGVVTPWLDKSADKEIKETQQLSQTFLELVNTLGLIDVWGCKKWTNKNYLLFRETQILF